MVVPSFTNGILNLTRWLVNFIKRMAVSSMKTIGIIMWILFMVQWGAFLFTDDIDWFYNAVLIGIGTTIVNTNG